MGRGAAGLGGNPGPGGSKIGWLADTDAASEPGQAAVTDIQFELKGRALPKDHGYALFLELARLLPWIAEDELLGIHPVHGADTGQGELMLSRRTKLVIRTPVDKVEEIMRLSGQTIRIAGEALAIGAAKTRPLTLHTPLYAHCVTTGSDDERAFAADIIRLLDEMGIDVIERQIDRTELYMANEAFFTGTATHIAPIGEIDHRPVGNGEIGSITAKLQKIYTDVIRGISPKYISWCTPVYK